VKHGEGMLSDGDGNITKAIWEKNVMTKIYEVNGE
jgi:hypothetical protein